MNKSNNRGCLAGIVGTLAVVFGVILYAILSSLLNNLLITLRFGENCSCALLRYSFAGIAVSFVLLEVIFIVWNIKANKKGGGEQKINKIFRIAVIACIILLLILPILTSNIFTRLDESSISEIFFIEYQKYDIATDAVRCTLSCSQDGKLSYILSMSDGKKIELFGSVNSCTDIFIDKYENLYGYAAYITESLDSPEYQLRIIGEEYMEQYYKSEHPDVWKYLEKMIDLK